MAGSNLAALPGEHPGAGRALPVLLALVLLALGFALIETPIGRALGDAVAAGLAVLAHPLLGLMGVETLRQGVELRSASGWAIRVSEVCDGLGLAVSLLALLCAVTRGWGVLLRRMLLALAVLAVLNLLRIAALALALHHAPEQFDLLHRRILPLLMLLVPAVILLPAVLLARAAAAVLLASLAFAALSPWIAKALAGAASALLDLWPIPGPKAVTLGPRGWGVDTLLLARLEPPESFRLPLDPLDYALSLPVLLAALALSLWRGKAGHSQGERSGGQRLSPGHSAHELSHEHLASGPSADGRVVGGPLVGKDLAGEDLGTDPSGPALSGTEALAIAPLGNWASETRRLILWSAFAAALILSAILLAATTLSWGLAETKGPLTLLIPTSDGRLRPEPWQPSLALLSLLRLAQNVLVHFLLLVLPFLILQDRVRR